MNIRKLIDAIKLKGWDGFHGVGSAMKTTASMIMGNSLKSELLFHNVFRFECIGADGKVKWVEEVSNRVVNEGLNYVLNASLKGGTQISSWLVGLTDGTPTTNEADTIDSHAGWVEVTDYAGNRKTLTLGSVTNQSVDNVGNEAAFLINATVTVGGGFIVDLDSDSAGVTMYGVVAFAGGNRSAVDGDTINVTATFTAATV